MTRLFVLIVAIGVFTATSAQAESPMPTIQIEQAWARASAGQAKTGVAYLALANTGEAGDRLIGAESPVADHVEFHLNIDDDGIMRMRKVDAIDVEPGEPVVFRPGGLHVMLMDLAAPLREGQQFLLALTFEKSGTVEVSVDVGKPGAMGP